MKLSDAMAIGRLDAHAQAELIRSGQISAPELTEAAIQRIEALDPQLRALSWPAFDLGRACASMPLPDHPLAGVPYLLKDSLDYPGLPSRGGSASRPLTPVASGHAYVRRLDEAGLVPVGKSAMPEFGLLGVTEPVIGPVTRNPWSFRHTPGGSSGGAGAAVAAGLVPLAHGSDGAGSIRIPSSCCGLVGLKPGRGTTVRVRARHVVEDLLVGDSLMARSVRDVAAGFALAHPDRPPPVTEPLRRRLRIGMVLPTLSGVMPEPAVIKAVTDTVMLCGELGHQIVSIGWPVDGPDADRAERILWCHIAADCVDGVRARGGDPERVLEPWTNALGRMAEAMGTDDLEFAFRQVAELPCRLSAFYADKYDVILTPTLTAPPPPLGFMAPDVEPERLMRRMFRWLGYTPLQNLSGTPAISLPLSWTEHGLPVGVMFAADRGQEELLLSLALELEQARPWADRWPPLSVMHPMTHPAL
ncbi:amidase family protein [Niveispirillum fermenti]|uniref:amidase family protein n=1 Tax=Niveispirillum fermenti TaxID=1233113 RepID=UPI003A894080